MTALMPDPDRLIHFLVSHYNEKVRWALDHKRWPHVREARVPGFHIPRARRLSGQSKLPIFIIDGVPLAGSSHILAEIERIRPDPALFPPDLQHRERARRLEAFFDDEVAPDLRRLFWSTYLPNSAAATRMATSCAGGFKRAVWRTLFPVLRPVFRRNMGISRESLARARERLPSYFDRIESELGPSGYLVGDRFGVADLAVASVMTAIIRPPEFPYPLPEPWPAALVELRESVADRPGFRWVLDMYVKHRGNSAEISAKMPA